MKTFYAHQRANLLLDDSGYNRIFNIDDITLGTIQKNKNCLIGSEMSNSPCYGLGQDYHKQVAFSAYGASDAHTNTPAFKGELQDSVTGHYLLGNGYRAYNLFLMRFNSPDSESPFAQGGVNSYAFVACDPINRNDPTGHMFEFITSKLSKFFIKKTYRGTIVAEFDGIVAFTKPARADNNLPTLYISAHGSPGFVSGDKVALYDGLRLHRTLKSRGINMDNRQTHLLACYSSTPYTRTGKSVADDLSSMTGAQASGYNDILAVEAYRQGNEFIVQTYKVLPIHGMTSTKIRAGNIRNPQKLAGNRQLKPASRTVIV